jgi:uncharacterized protein (TIGR03067 family)
MSDNELTGTWQVVSAELGGQPMPADAAAKVELEFTATHYTVNFGGEATDHGTFELKTNSELNEIAMTGITGVNEGRTIPGILQLHGNRLRICFALEGSAIPREFRAPAGTLRYLATYRRKDTPKSHDP